MSSASASSRFRARKTALAALLLGLLGFWLIPVVEVERPTSAVLLDRNGQLLGASVASDEQWRFPDAEPVPEKFKTALIVQEDRRFRWHPGVDPVAVVRAIRSNIAEGEVVSGASTITMQVVRMSRSNPPRTLGEKVLEAILAVRLSASASKEEVLARYAANAPFGGNTVGLEAASWRYFGRAPAELSWAEAATLAALPNRPGLIHPGRARDALKERRDRLLRDLHEYGAFDQTDLDLALAEPLPMAPHPIPMDAPHLLASSTGRVHTTLDRDLQLRATEVLERHHAQLAGGGVFNAAAVIVDLETGEVRAYIGNVHSDGTHGDRVDVVRASRSTGSLLKPFLYEGVLEEGMMLPDQLVMDLPWKIGDFTPENFDRTYEGAVPASEALARSRNVPAVWMLQKYGVERFDGRLRKLGMTTLFRSAQDYGLALIVGGAEGNLWDLTGMYRDLGLSVAHPDGPLPPAMHWRVDPNPQNRPALHDPAAAWLTLQSLVEVNRPGDLGGWRAFRGSTKISWKTGTSHGFRDAWAIGITPTTAIGVWVGNADGEGRPGLTGYQAAAPILFDLFGLVGPAGDFPRPDAHLVSVKICAHSGMLAGPDCPNAVDRWVPKAGKRGPACNFCQQVHCDAGCVHRVNNSCSSVAAMENRSWFVLPPAMEWFYARNHPEYDPPPPLRSDCEGSGSEGIAVLYPPQDATIFLPIELDGTRGRIVLEASHRDGQAEIFWHLDEEYVGTTVSPHQISVSPTPGEHRLTLVDQAGARVVRRFTVLDRTTPDAGR